MNHRNDKRSAARLLVAGLALCLATVACDRREETVPGDSADATNPTAGDMAAPQVDADRALADRTRVDPCAGLSGPALDECRMQQDSAEIVGEVPMAGEETPVEPRDAAGLPPPVTEEPMDNEPVEEASDEVPPPA